MCDVKAEGGRRCPSSTPEGKRAYRARLKERRLAEAAAAHSHHNTDPAPVPQAVVDAAAHDARVAFYTDLDQFDTDAREWADLPIDTEVGAEWVAVGFGPATAAAWLNAGPGTLGQHELMTNFRDEAVENFCEDVLSSAPDWFACGVEDHNEALTWTFFGASPEEAAAWKQTGISVSEATEWLEFEVPVADAPVWRKAGFDPGTTSLWANEYEPAAACQWADAGVPDGSTAQGWEQHGFSAAQARQWISAGEGCATTAGDYVGALPQVARPHALSAFQCGYTADEAAALDWDDPQVVAGLRTIGALRTGVSPSSPAA